MAMVGFACRARLSSRTGRQRKRESAIKPTGAAVLGIDRAVVLEIGRAVVLAAAADPLDSRSG
jgi:hypothetical protein